MSLRKGDNSKKGQAYQNTFKFRPNKNSKKSKQLQQTPLDHLCKRCYDVIKWKIDYKKYKPLTTPGKCN